MSVRVIHGVGGPTTCNVVEEEGRHVTGTMIVLAAPFIIIGNRKPVVQPRRHLRREVITVHHVLAMANQTVLIEQGTAEVIVHILRTTAERNVVLLRRHAFAIHFLKPIGICPRTVVHAPRLVGSITAPRGGHLVAGFRCAVDVVFNLLQHVVAEGQSLTIVGGSVVPIARKVVGVGHLGHLRSR